jgi:membrane-bound ClpP family serine protease
MSWIFLLLLILGGLILLILELLVVPGTTVVGVIGFILIATGIWQAYVAYGITVGTIVLVAVVILSVLALIYSLRSKTWEKVKLNSSIDSRVNTHSQKLSVGDRGTTISRLNPMGKALFNGEYYEVSSFVEFIPNNTPVEIVEIDGAKVYVKQC